MNLDTSNPKTRYIIGFLALVGTAILVGVGDTTGDLAMSTRVAEFMTLVGKLGLIAITIWYALKVKMKKHWAWVLGLSTLLPLMTWISFIILLTRKPVSVGSVAREEVSTGEEIGS